MHQYSEADCSKAFAFSADRDVRAPAYTKAKSNCSEDAAIAVDIQRPQMVFDFVEHFAFRSAQSLRYSGFIRSIACRLPDRLPAPGFRLFENLVTDRCGDFTRPAP